MKGDFSDNSPGWKFAEWEMKGVPLRLELGPRDIEAGVCVAARRDNGRKAHRVARLAGDRGAELAQEAVQQGLFAQSQKNLEDHTYTASTVEEVKDVVENRGGGFIKTMWCGDEACELKMKELARRVQPLPSLRSGAPGRHRPVCGRAAKKMVVWGVAY